MPVTTFAIPILPGKTDAWKQAASSLSGDRKADFEDLNRRLGISRHVASLQETPQCVWAPAITLDRSPPNGHCRHNMLRGGP